MCFFVQFTREEKGRRKESSNLRFLQTFRDFLAFIGD